MKTAEQREAQLREELEVLLERHGASLTLEDDTSSWAPKFIMKIEMDSTYDDNGDLLAEYCEFEI